MFGSRGKKKDVNDRDNFDPIDLANLTDSLYKQNIEVASKNKSLSISKKIYDISIMSLDHQELADRITKIIQEELDVELAGIFLHDQEKSVFNPLSFECSDRLTDIQATLNIDFNTIEISADDNPVLKEVIENKVTLHETDLSSIWGDGITKNQHKELHDAGHIKTTIISPLLIDDDIIGLAIFALNKEYDNISDFEIEAIGDFGTIISVTIDRALIYEQLKTTNVELEEVNTKLKEIDQLKTEFVSLASHQLQGPLTAIRGYASLITGGDYGEVNDEVVEATGKIEIASKSMIELVTEYLNVSKIELGHMEYSFEEFQYKELLNEVIEEIKPRINNEKQTLNAVMSDEEILISADRNKLKQVLLNIIGNAIKYTPEGAIFIALSKSGRKAFVEVKDTGLGIKKEVIPLLFERFSRSDSKTKTKIEGSGLGLYLAHKIMEEHKGNISVKSDGEGLGSVFVIEMNTVK